MARTRDVGRDVACLERAQDLVNEQPVAGLEGDLGEELVAAVHGIAGLEGSDRRPAFFGEERPGLGGAQVEPAIGLGKVPLGENRDRARQVEGALGHDLGDARVGLVGGAVDLAALERLVDGVCLADGEDAEDLPAFVRQRHLVADGDGKVLAAGKRDGQRPEEPVLQAHLQARAAPVGCPHEAIERRVGAHREHEEVRHLAGRQRQLLQGARPASAPRPAPPRAAAGASGWRCRAGESASAQEIPTWDAPRARTRNVMAGLVPAIHGIFVRQGERTWMPGTSPGMTSWGCCAHGKIFSSGTLIDDVVDGGLLHRPFPGSPDRSETA